MSQLGNENVIVSQCIWLIFLKMSFLQVTDSTSVDVEALRKKSLNNSKSNSLRGSSSSVVSLNDVTHPTVGAGAVTTSPRNRHQEQFENGDVLVTLLPVNEKFPWVTPAKFRPELVPEELMAPTLTVHFKLLQIKMHLLISDLVSVDGGRICEQFGEVNSRHEIYNVHNILQENSGYLDFYCFHDFAGNFVQQTIWSCFVWTRCCLVNM